VIGTGYPLRGKFFRPDKSGQNKYMKKIFLISFLTLLFSCIFINQSQAAGGLVPCGGKDQADCQFCHIFLLINNILDLILTRLVPLIAVLFLIFGGLYMLFARGNPGTLGQAKSIITATIIGMVIIFIAWVALNTFLDYMGIVEWTRLGSWWDLTDKCPITP
jgi:hypothetical protein